MELAQDNSPIADQLFVVELVEQDGPPSSPGCKPRKSFREAVRMCWDKYADFGGRARRSEYWWFSLFALLVFLAPSLPLLALFKYFDLSSAQDFEVLWALLAILLGIVLGVSILILLCPIYAAMTRRLHDVGRSGKWIIWDIVMTIVSSIVLSVAYAKVNYATDAIEPDDFTMLKSIFESSLPMLVVASVFLLYCVHVLISVTIVIFTLLDSQRGENKYGPSPKYQ